MTGVAANLCGSKTEVDKLIENNAKIGIRHGICSDLSPLATLIAASYNRNFSPSAFEARANAVLNKVEDELGWMFETEVDINAGNKVNKVKGKITSVIWSDVFSCPNCGVEFRFGDLSIDFNNKELIDIISFITINMSLYTVANYMRKHRKKVNEEIKQIIDETLHESDEILAKKNIEELK